MRSFIDSAVLRRCVARTRLRSGMVADWSMDEASGNRVDGVNGYALVPANATSASGGIHGNAVNLVRASSQKLTLASNSNIRLNESADGWTLALWVNLTTTPSDISQFGIVYKSNAASAREYELRWTQSTKRFTGLIFNGVSTAQATVAANNLGDVAAGVWYHIVLWFDPRVGAYGALRMVVNGGRTDSATLSAAPASNGNDLVIGYDTSRYFDGLIDDLRLWRRALTPTERRWLYNAGRGRLL